MRPPRKSESQSQVSRGIVVSGAALLVLGTIGRDLMFRNGSLSTGLPSQLEIFLIFLPSIGVLAVSVGVIGMLFHDVQKEHTDRLVGRLQDLSNPRS